MPYAQEVTPKPCTGMHLPHSLPIYESLTRSGHYHFGYFSSTKQNLRSALDDLPLTQLHRLPHRERVLDVGCGIGGTTDLLTQRGFPTLGVDPSRESIAYACGRRATPMTKFVRRRFEQLRPQPARFGAVMMVEVTQHFACLTRALARAAHMLQPGGVIVIHDLFVVPDLPRDRVPYHQRSALQEAARELGLEVLTQEAITEHVTPTVPQLLQLLRKYRRRVVHGLRPDRPDVEAEIRELETNLQVLHDAIRNGDLVYESCVIRNPGGW